MKLKKILHEYESSIKNILNIILFLLILWILFIYHKFVELWFKLEKRLETQELKSDLQESRKEINILKKQLFLSNIDLLSDDSITKFVNNKIHFFDLSYTPKNLVPVSWDHIIDSKGWYIKVRKELKNELSKLASDFYKDTNNNIVIVSWYRSYNYQKWIKDRGCPDNFCAKAWYSEHQSWLSIDIYSASSQKHWLNDNNLKKHFSWFKDNAYKYGFHNTYQKWIDIDWYEIEPWHWRYVWKDLAKYLYENNMTFAEFYYKRYWDKY